MPNDDYPGYGWPDGLPMKKRKSRKKEGGYRKIKIKYYKKQGGICFYCQKPMEFLDCNVDHVVPSSRGGGSPNNLVVAHIDCNQIKADRMPTQAELLRLKELYGTNN